MAINVDMSRQQVAFLDAALLLLRQPPEHLPEILAQVPV